MLINEARERLIVALAEDLAGSLDRRQERVAFCRKGLVGFDNMTVSQLLQCAVDSGVDKHEDHQPAIMVLRGVRDDAEWAVRMCATAGIGLRQDTHGQFVDQWYWDTLEDTGGEYHATCEEAGAAAIEHHFPREDWQTEAANNDTKLGYQEWVLHKAEDFANDRASSPVPA